MIKAYLNFYLQLAVSFFLQLAVSFFFLDYSNSSMKWKPGP